MTGIDTGEVEQQPERIWRDPHTGACYLAPDEGDVEYVRADTIAALRKKLEAAEATKFRLVTERNAMEAERNEARAGQSAAWEAGRDAAADKCRENSMSSMAGEKAIRALTPPADLSTALQAVKDAEWNAALEAVEGLEPRGVSISAIRAIRRAAPTGGSH